MAIPTVPLANTPAGGAYVRDGDDRIREYKLQMHEIMEVDHDFPETGNSLTVGQHKQLTLQEKADLGTGAAGVCLLGAETTVDAKPELVYTDEDDDSVQITKDGKLNALALAGVYPAANVAAIATMMALIYPVGYVITLGVSTNPATLLGIGTWTAIEGKVIVGISDEVGDAAFDTLNETGGAQTHTLLEAELPAHTHTYLNMVQSGGGTYGADGWASGQGNSAGATGTVGSGTAFSILPPYIVKYVWQRTA
jgi:hypothetical protein